MSTRRKQDVTTDNGEADAEPSFIGVNVIADDGAETLITSTDYPCLAADNKRKHAAQGKPYTSQAQMMIVNALQYYRAENAELAKEEQFSVFDKVAAVLDVAPKTVRNIDAKAKSQEYLNTPGKKRTKRVVVDAFMVNNIRRMVGT